MKILLYTDLTIRADQLFWHRDLGLLTKAFRDLGHDAYLVVHLATEPTPPPAISSELDRTKEQPFDMSSEALAKEEAPPEQSEALTALGRQPFEAPPAQSKVWSEVGPHSEIRAQARLYPDPVGAATAGQNPPVAGALHSSDRYSESSEVGQPSYSPNNPVDPVLWVSQQDVRNPSWWQSQKPDLVILGLWTRPKYDPIRRAALSATPRVIERADSDGMRTASCGFFTYAKRRFDYFRDRTFRWPSPLSILASIFYSFTSILVTPWIETRLARTLKLLPAIAVETPPAALLWKSLASRLGANPEKIHHVPHPIQTDIFKFDPAISKKNQIISVGRWESYQKNLPLLLKTLRTFLDKNPSWTSLVIGSGLPAKSPHPRITFLSPLPPPDLARLMQDSKIFFYSSQYESFGLASAEALACGCAVVGTPMFFGQSNNLSFPESPSFGSTFTLLRGKLQHVADANPPSKSPMTILPEFSPQKIILRLTELFTSNG